MAALTLFIFSLLVSTTFAENTQVVEEEERPAFQALPLQLNAEKKSFYFHLYFQEIFSGANTTTVTAVNPANKDTQFGEIAIMDVPLWDSLFRKRIVARAQGVNIQSDQKTLGWHLSMNIVFEQPEVKGSTLLVLGRALQDTTQREFAIVGGTGNFTLAQGSMYGRRLSSIDENELWIEFKIFGYYTPMEKPKW